MKLSTNNKINIKKLENINGKSPDLVIRTGGEYRISNFLTWQSAYSEFIFTDILWPDFKPKHIDDAIYKFSGRNRRFGGL